jgi:hypothetical protein
MRNIKVLIIILCVLVASTGCLSGNIVDDKYYLNAVGNLTPAKSLKFFVGSPTYKWAGGYFANLTADHLNLYNDATQISRDGAGNMIFTDAISGTSTLTDLLAGGGGGANVTGTGTAGRMVRWNGLTVIGDATNTDAQVSTAVTNSHVQNSDTNLGLLAVKPLALDADKFVIRDSAGADLLNTTTGSQLKGYLKTYFDTLYALLGTGNVTGTGSATRIPYWSGAQVLGNTNIYFDIPNGRYGIGTTAPQKLLHLHDGSGENGIQISYTIGSLYSNITSDIFGHLKLRPSGGLTINTGNLSMDTHYINDVINPSQAQDAATKNYVDTAIAGVGIGSGNITGAGTTGYMVQWSNTSVITNATNTNAQLSAAVTATHSQNTDTSLGVQTVSLNMGTNNITSVGYVDGYDVSTLGLASHTQGTDTTLGALTANISMGNHYINNLGDPSNAQDAATKNYVDTEIAGIPAGSGNVTVTTSTIGYLPKFSSTTNLVNSTISSNATWVYIDNSLNLTGNITLASGKTVDGKDVSGLATSAEAVTAAKADADIADAISKKHSQNTDTALGVLSANISANSKYINSLSDPSQAQDAATKNYVDTQIAGIPAGSGNVTTSGGVANTIPKYTSATNINGSTLTDNGTWVVTSGYFQAIKYNSTQATGTSPFTVASTTNVTNLNADYVDGYHLNQDVLTSSSPTHVAMTLSQATGTAPLTISSTTNVTNLNADYLDGYHASNFTTISITAIIDGGGSAITTGIKGDLEIPFACAINQATAFADTTGNISVSIWKDTYTNFPPTSVDNITAAAPISIVNSNKSQDGTLSGWTKTIVAGDTLRFNVDSVNTITRVTISLRAVRQ